MSTKASFPFSPCLPRPPIFSMVSKLTLCSPTWDCRIQQLMQPLIWLETLTTQSAVPLEMYGPCCTAQFDSSIVTTCGQHCTLLYFVWKRRSSLLCSWWWWTVHHTGSERVPIAFEFLANLPPAFRWWRKKFRRKNPEVSGFLPHCLLQSTTEWRFKTRISNSCNRPKVYGEVFGDPKKSLENIKV